MLPPRPTITISYAQTLDGRLATVTGSSQWISGPESLSFAHGLRASHDAIMVGVGTVQQDDPRLTVRLVPGRDPLRIVVDSTLRIAPTAAVLRDGAATGTLIATTERAAHEQRASLESLGATLLTLPTNTAGQVDLAALTVALHKRGVGSVMVEGGAALITALLRARLADRLAVCIAPKILGSGIAAVGDLGIRNLDHALMLHAVNVTYHGADLVLNGQIRYREAEPHA